MVEYGLTKHNIAVGSSNFKIRWEISSFLTKYGIFDREKTFWGELEMLKAFEVLGTDLPIFKEKEIDQFTLEEIWHLELDMSGLAKAGYVLHSILGESFFKPVYSQIKQDDWREISW